jgi:hypothetical protein
MKLRVIHEPWSTERPYIVQESRPWSTSKEEMWMSVARFETQVEAEVHAQARIKGPTVIKEYDNNMEFKDHERTFL